MRSPIPLEQLHIAEPCHADWNTMAGDEKSRFCETCQKHVHDLSARTRAEGEALLAACDGSLCVQFQRRADGTVLTRDGLRRYRFVRRLTAAASFALAFIAMLPGCRRDAATTQMTGTPLPGKTAPLADRLILGEIAAPMTSPATQPTTIGDVGPAIRGEVSVPPATQPVLSPLPVLPGEG